MKARWLVAVLVCCCARAVMAQSPPPAPTPSKPGQKPQQERAAVSREAYGDHGAPQQLPASPNLKVTPKAQLIAPNANKKESDKSATDRWLITFTGCLVLVGALQWWAMHRQARYMRDATVQTRNAADAATAGAAAAKASAEAAKESNRIADRSLELGRRAWLVIHGAPRLVRGSGWVFDSVTVENISDMPAIIRGFDTGLVEGDPKSLSLKEGNTVPADLIIRDCRINLELPPIPPVQCSPEDPAAVELACQSSAVYCIVGYTDCFEQEWHTTVCWSMSPYDDWERYYYRLR